MKSKQVKIIVSVTILLILVVCTYNNFLNKNEEIVLNKEEQTKTGTTALSMMYETEAGSGNYEESSESSWPSDGYTFNETLSKCEQGGILTWNEDEHKVYLSTTKSDKCYVYFDKLPDGMLLADYIKGLYTTDGANGLYLHDADLANGANDGSYRYAGANPNNFVCFGSDATPCPDDNLYRIIGVFNELNVETKTKEARVKLIKAYEAGENTLGKAPDDTTSPDATYYKGKLTSIPIYYWSGSSSNTSNTWSSSTLNTETLNGTYLTKLGTEWTNKIATTRWQVGGGTLAQLRDVTPTVAYQNEIGTPVNNTTYDAKVGLRYVSEYGYAASLENWTTTLVDYNNDTNINNNWMHLGAYEWTISRASDLTASAFRVYGNGFVHHNYVYYTYVVRPSIVLESSVTYAGGTGTEIDPIRIV